MRRDTGEGGSEGVASGEGIHAAQSGEHEEGQGPLRWLAARSRARW